MAAIHYVKVTNPDASVDYYEVTDGAGHGSVTIAEDLLTDAVGDGAIMTFEPVNAVPAGQIVLGYTNFRLFMCKIMLGLD